MIRRTPLERVLSRVAADASGCWLWTGALLRDGYAAIKVSGKVTVAHRVAYAAMVGPIPEGLELDHVCNVRNCVRPEHLEPVTHAENQRRAAVRRRAQRAYADELDSLAPAFARINSG